MISPRARQLLRKLLLRRPGEFSDLCEKKWVLAPAETGMMPPAIQIEGSMDRIVELMPDATMEYELLLAKGGVIQHSATVAFEFAGVEVDGGFAYKGAVRQGLVPGERMLPVAGAREWIDRAVMASTYCGNKYFGHWLSDDLTVQLAAEGIAPAVGLRRMPYVHEAGYREMFALPERLVDRASFASLILLDDRGQNRYKRERYETLRKKMRSVEGKGNELVYLRRGTQGAARCMVNEVEIEETLVGLGFVVVDPETLSARELVEQLLDARLICGVEGSQMYPAIYALREGGGVLAFVPPYRFNNPLKGLLNCVELQYGFLVGTTCEGGFTIDVEELKRVLPRFG